MTPLTALAEALAIHRFFRVKRLNDHQTPMPTVTHEVPAISGAFMCMRVLDFQRMYGMDEGYFLHVEDLDLCMRVRSLRQNHLRAASAGDAHAVDQRRSQFAFH